MEEHPGFGFDEFSVEIEDFEYVQVKKFDRIFNMTEGGSFAQQPLVVDGVVYVGCHDRNVYAIDARTGDPVWKFRGEGAFSPSSPVHLDGVIYIGCYDYNLYALDAKTGAMVWKFPTREKVIACACAQDGRVYFGSNDYNVYCLDAKTGAMVWKYKTQGEVVSTPTVHAGKLFVGSYDRIMYCLDARTGALIWKFETQGNIFNQPQLLIHDNKVYFPSFDNLLRVVDIDTGKLVWKFRTGQYGGMGSGPLLYKGILYQTNREGVLHAITLDGKKIWSFRISHAMGQPLIHEDRIYVGTEDQNLYCIDLKGHVLWKFKTQGELWWEPTVWRDWVYFTSWDCHVYCIRKDNQRLVWRFRGQGSPAYMPPPFESYELSVKKSFADAGIEEAETRKRYDMGAAESEDSASQYKSRVTYQMSSQYQSRGGKYQVDSDEEAL